MESIVVVGASLAGLRAVETLRREGYEGRLTLVGAEPHLPYDRPPLSKEMLAGDWEHDQVVLRKVPYEELDLELRLGVGATALDVGARTVTLAGGTELPFDGWTRAPACA
jgi:NADPH-dependent 2,4-dienoyl-CoA reductase/sulfur reductase-like enzyme